MVKPEHIQKQHEDGIRLQFEDFTFEELDDRIKVHFLKIFYFFLNKRDLKNIGDFTVEKNAIMFKNVTEQKARHKFNFLLNKGFAHLTNKVSGRKTVYVHKNSGIPLMGSLYFGIVDRGSNLLVIRPMTSCNMNCIFCSVDEGTDSSRTMDFVVEKDYLVEEVKKLMAFKQQDVEIYINPQGEPMLYGDLVPLIEDLSKIKHISVISIITNGTLLNEANIDEMVAAGLIQINLSLNAATDSVAKTLEGSKGYHLERVLAMAKYASKKVKLIIAPVLMPDYNEKDMDRLAEIAKELNAELLIQKFLRNKKGRNPIKEPKWEYFYDLLDTLERKHNVPLRPDFTGYATKELPVPFKKGDHTVAQIVCEGVHPNERLAVASNRVISLFNCHKKKGPIEIELLRSKHNIFSGRIKK